MNNKMTPEEKNTDKVGKQATTAVNNVTYIFSHTTLLDALTEWEQEQIQHYPHQKEKIQTTVVAMQHFLRSPQVRDHKMILSGNPENFEIVLPDDSIKS